MITQRMGEGRAVAGIGVAMVRLRVLEGQDFDGL